MSERFLALKERMLADAEVRKGYEALGAEFELASELIAARVEPRAGPHSSKSSG